MALGWFKGVFGWLSRRGLPPVSRQGRDRVRVVMGKKVVTLQGELLRDNAGYLLWVAVPTTCLWDKPAGEPISDEERQAILALLKDKNQWQPGERFDV